MTDAPTPPETTEPQERPPFNEVSVLFPLLTFYTASYMALMVADFFLKGKLDLPAGLMSVYIALLGAYAADKEIRRWLGTPEPRRNGSLFVYLWLLLYLAFGIIHSFQRDYAIPANLMTICLQVLGIFFGSKASKYVCEKRNNSSEVEPRPPLEDSGREKIVLDMIAAQGQVTRRDIMEKFGISDNAANRILQGMNDKKSLFGRCGQSPSKTGLKHCLPS